MGGECGTNFHLFPNIIDFKKDSKGDLAGGAFLKVVTKKKGVSMVVTLFFLKTKKVII